MMVGHVKLETSSLLLLHLFAAAAAAAALLTPPPFSSSSLCTYVCSSGPSFFSSHLPSFPPPC